MNIKELAEQAGASVEADTIIVNGKDADDFVKRFAELVRQDERNRQRTKKEWSDHDRAIAAAERESCAELAENIVSNKGYVQASYVAKAIRARSKHD